MSNRSKKRGTAGRASAEVAEEERAEESASAEDSNGTLEVLDTSELDDETSDDELTQQLGSARSELQTLNDRHLRLAAEFQNYRRRAEADMGETRGRAQADLVKRFLDVLDDLQRVAALDGDEKINVQAIVDGVDLVERKFARALADAGVEVVNPERERFDPSTMEAVMSVPAESEDEDELVHQVFQKGYLLKGYLIRPARVSVKKHG